MRKRHTPQENFCNAINRRNLYHVRREINKLVSSFEPYTATQNQAEEIITDIDHFPYTRRYRSTPSDFYPRVMEREAGFRPMNNACYDAPDRLLMHDSYPNNCFQTACSTVDLCVPGKNPRMPRPLPIQDILDNEDMEHAS
ncbi:MAG: hypothetical protein K0U52_14215 [Gammaproteobacteria bacterium]|jgi:hypothetical protein|nr:hypothetical protein [Gammaproteobacteria bacterium]